MGDDNARSMPVDPRITTTSREHTRAHCHEGEPHAADSRVRAQAWSMPTTAACRAWWDVRCLGVDDFNRERELNLGMEADTDFVTADLSDRVVCAQAMPIDRDADLAVDSLDDVR